MDSWVFPILMVAALVLMAVIEFWSGAGTYGWLDVRSAEDADDVRRNIDEYGPEAPGLKLHLLPADERAAVLAARDAARAQRDARRHRRPVRH